MVTPTDVKHIVRDPTTYGGKPCIEDHRISVHDVVVWSRQGRSPDAIARDFHLTRAQVHAALSYYYDHQDEIDREIAEEQTEIATHAEADDSSLAQCVRAVIARIQHRSDHACSSDSQLPRSHGRVPGRD